MLQTTTHRTQAEQSNSSLLASEITAGKVEAEAQTHEFWPKEGRQGPGPGCTDAFSNSAQGSVRVAGLQPGLSIPTSSSFMFWERLVGVREAGLGPRHDSTEACLNR